MNVLRKLFSSKVSPEPIVEVAAAPVAEAEIDPRKVGYEDAVNSGWYKRETGELLEGFQITAEDTVLDVGCGEGLATLFCASQGAHVVFTDVETQKVQALTEKANRSKARKVEGFTSDSMPLPVADGYASRIMAMEMLEHTEKPEEILQELVRVGKPGAQYLITVPDDRSEVLQQPFADPSYFAPPNHIQIFDKEQFSKLVEDSGLIIERHVTWGFYWVMWMSIFWSIPSEEKEGETLGLVSPPYHPALQSWANTWRELQKIQGTQPMIDAFNQALPKAQAIIARKPG